jgi:ACS family hexuronate transporter-like MFS transporter
MAVASVNLAASVGAIFAPLLVPMIAVPFGWRAAVVVAGMCGVAWVLFWLRLPLQQNEARHVTGQAKKINLWRDGSVWALVSAKACTDQYWWLAIYWFPDFFERTYSQNSSSWGVAMMLSAVLSALGGLIAHFIIGRAGLIVIIAMAVAIILPFGALPASMLVSAGLLGAGLLGHQIISTRIFFVMSGDKYSGRVGSLVGIGAFASHALGGATMALIGAALASGVGYGQIFLATSGLYAVGAALLVIASYRSRLDQPPMA